MALWGNKDSFDNLTGSIAINLGTEVVTGTGASFVTAGISTGDVLIVGTGATHGFAVVSGITSENQLSIGSTQFLIGSPITGVAYTVSQLPISSLEDSVYRGPYSKTVGYSTSPVYTRVFGVDEIEVGVANTATGDARKYAPAHTGWVGVLQHIWIMLVTSELRLKFLLLVESQLTSMLRTFTIQMLVD